jgi:lysozyme
MNYEKLVKSIKENEGLSLIVYDCPAGKKTIGYGRNLEDNGISEYEAYLLLTNDILKIVKWLEDFFSPYNKFKNSFSNFPDNVKNVMIEMCYQLGFGGFKKFGRTIKHIDNFDFKQASIEMLNSKWAKQTPNRAKALSNLMKGGF